MGEVWMIFTITLLFFIIISAVDGSNLPLLSGTLRTFQVHACDGDDLKIDCVPNTVISINLAQYGRQVPSHQLCPPKGLDITPKNDTTDCVASEALRTVEAACREQRECRITTSPDSFGGDPCPGVRKYAEVAYKCRPNTFFNKITCEGDRLRLRCHRDSRIVIYSAAFGGTHYELVECPQPDGVKGQDCQVSYATETVMSSCHGRRKCSVGADVGTFGNPNCPKGVKLSLKVVYTCVPKGILKELDLGSSEGGTGDSTREQVDDADYPGMVDQHVLPPSEGSASPPAWSGDIQYTKAKSQDPTVETRSSPGDVRSSGAKTTPKTDMQSDENLDQDNPDANCTEEQKVIGFLTEWINAYNFIKANKEKFILYLTVSLSAGLVAFLLVLAGRLWYLKRRQRQERLKLNISEPLTGNAYGVDDDLDTFDAGVNGAPGTVRGSAAGVSDVEVVRYANRNTMRRQDSDSHPRAPMARSLNNYYYS